MPYSILLPVKAALIFLKTVRSDISLSPKTWPLDEFDRMDRRTLNRFERPKPLAVRTGKAWWREQLNLSLCIQEWKR